MIALQPTESESENVVIEAKSNLSMTLDRLMAVFAGICILSLLVVAWPVMMGLWPILLAALLHLLVVGLCFRSAWRGNWAREELQISDGKLIVRHLRAGLQRKTEWPVAWSRVQTEEGRFSEIRVFIVSQGRRQEIGAFLPVNERAQLAEMLNHALRPHSAWRS